MGMFFYKSYSDGATYEDKFTRSLRIEGQVAVADLEVPVETRGLFPTNEPVTLQAHLDFSGVSETQMFLWAVCTKMTSIHRAIRLCSLDFLSNFFKQGPVCYPASTVETKLVDPDVNGLMSSKESLFQKSLEYLLCLSSIERQVAVIDIAVHQSAYLSSIDDDKDDYIEYLDSQIRLDFSGVSETQMFLWAARTKMIDLQRALYRCGEHDEQFLNDLAQQGKPVCRHASEAGIAFDDAAKKQQHVMATAQNMSAEDRAALIKLLQEMDK